MAAVLADAPRQDDRLFLAIACSLVLHLAILWLVPGFFQPRAEIPPPKALTARLVAPKAEPAKAIEPPAPPPPQPAAKRHRPVPHHKPTPGAVTPVAPPVSGSPIDTNPADVTSAISDSRSSMSFCIRITPS